MVNDPYPLPGSLRMAWRGVMRRCPRCGGGELFDGWLQMRPRCPRCGIRFEREEGFFLGAFVINFGITLVSLAAFIGVGLAATLPDPPQEMLAAAGAALVVVVAVFFYPTSRTVWSAIDLRMRPLEAAEIESARRTSASGGP